MRASASASQAWGVDVVRLRLRDQAIRHFCGLAQAIRPGERSRLPSKGNAAERSFGRVVVEADPTVVWEPRERVA
jgi:hypothetical protein